MPDMDGFEVCRRLRATPDTAHLPIVLLTALDRPADRVRGLESGADDFLTKTCRRDRADRPRSLAGSAQVFDR
jgi:DNA-binding response OmpR family regulator